MESMTLPPREVMLANLSRVKEPRFKDPELLDWIATLSGGLFTGPELVDAVRDVIKRWQGPPETVQSALRRCMDFVHALVEESAILEDAITHNARRVLEGNG